MQYSKFGETNQYPYPNNNIPPEDKGADYCMQYAKAAYYDWNNSSIKGVFSNNGGDYEKFRLYAMGKQPNGQYKTLLGVDPLTDNTWMSVDWGIRPIISVYRDKVLSRLMQQDFAIECTPIDMQSKTDIDKMYNAIKAKLAVRQMMMQQNPELANHPFIQLQKGEPLDIEELEMRVQEGEQFNRSKDAEMAIELGFYENDYKEVRSQWYKDLFDLGVAGYREWLGDDNKAKFRSCDPEVVGVGFSKDGTFKDIPHAFEQIEVPLIELALVRDSEGNIMFSDKELTEFAGSLTGKFGNPSGMGYSNIPKPYDKFKCKVIDIEFYTYNESVYRTGTDENGNNDFRKADYNRGKKSEKYLRKRIQYVYKCKWVVGTDKCYDWGMCYDQKRSVDVKKKAKTSLSFKFTAINFYKMMAQGYMERLIPYLDDYQLTMLKIQNFKNRAVPSGWWINLDRLENVAMSKGGKNMTPRELIQMFFETGVLAGRNIDQQNHPMGSELPIIPIANTAASELAMFYQDLQNTIMAIEKMTGYNSVTMGEANPKTLVPGYELGNQATEDAIYPLKKAEENLTLRLAEDVLCRMKQGIRKGEVTGYAPYNGALGTNTLRFISMDYSTSLRDHGIMLQERTSEQDKIWIMQQIQQDIANGLLDVSDAIYIIYTHNAKSAMQILAYRVQQAKEKINQQELSKIQVNNQGQMQMLQMNAQVEQAKLEAELGSKERIKQMEIQGELMREKMRNESQERMNHSTNTAKVMVGEDTGTSKIISTDLAGQHAAHKQAIANSKPTSSSN